MTKEPAFAASLQQAQDAIRLAVQQGASLENVAQAAEYAVCAESLRLCNNAIVKAALLVRKNRHTFAKLCCKHGLWR